MNKKLFTRAGLVLTAIVFLAFTMITSVVLRNWRVDLTENGLFTVADGTKAVLKKIDEPINLYFFFSEKNTKDMAGLRSYAQRVRELLQQYENLAQGKIKLHIIDPVPFSEDEDKAAQYGLQAVPVAPNTEIYFGLVGTNSVDEKETIRFFQPDKEETLEYDISKLVAKLSQTKPPVVALISGMQVNGGFDYMTRQPKEGWIAFEQLKQFYNVRDVNSDVSEIADDVNLLLLVQPKGLSDKTRYAIDQYVLRGGKLIVFVDPFAEMDKLPQSQQNPFPQTVAGDDINTLLAPWGVKVDMNKVVVDSEHALSVNTGAGRAPTRHLALLGLSGRDNAGESIVGGLESLNIGTTGAIETLKVDGITVTPVLQTSSNAALLDRAKFEFLPDPSTLQKDFVAAGQRYAIMSRIEGKAKSGFEKAPEGVSAEHLSEAKDSIRVLVVADTDVLSDRMWVQVQDFFGQRMAQPFADNGNLLLNAVETYSGSADLIGLRSRGRYARPFEKVADIKRNAEVEFRQREDELQKQLDETEKQLQDLQRRMKETGQAQLNPQEESALQKFQSEKVRIRKELREVQHQLNRNIEALGTKLKLINIGLMPLLLIVLATFIALSRQSKGKKARE